MAVLYKNRIIREAVNPTIVDKFVIDDVPRTWRAQTLQLLNDAGYDGYGNPL